MNQKETHFNEAVSSIIKYLYSDENLYPQLESNMIEALLYLDSNKIDTRNLKNLKEISEDIFFKKNKYKPLSEYSRAVSLLLCYMFNREIINDLATHYIKYDEYDYILKKYLIFIALTSNNLYLTSQVLEKAKKEQNFSINRLINFIGNINYYKKSNAVKGYLKESKYIYIHKNNINGEWVKESYNPIRVKILKVLINKYSKV